MIPEKEPFVKLLVICIGITVCLVTFGGWNAWRIYTDTVMAWEKSSEIQNISHEIIHLDEILTMSARMSASTGNKFWENRYRRYEPELRKLIDKLQEISPEKGVKKFISQTESANNILVNWETDAFLWVQKGNMEKAKEVLFSKEYEEQKLIYSRGIQDLIKKVALRNQNEITRNTNRLFTFNLICGLLLLLGWVAGLIALQKHFSQRRKAEILFTRLGRILDNSFNEIYTFDAETFKFRQVSLGACKNLQYSNEELIHLTPLDLKPKYTPEKFEDLVKPLRLKREAIINFETVHQRKDGTHYPVDVRLQLMHEESPPVFVAIIQDITQSKKDKEKLLRYADQLEKSNVELESFALVASHDLQEPLRKIITFGDRLRESVKNLDEVNLDYIDRMQKAGSRMHALIEDLLKLSRVGSQLQKYVKAVDLSQIVNQSIVALETGITERNGKINLDSLPVADANPVQMVQLFQNLIGNALKYHRDGVDPVINISGGASENGTIQIIVEDNGIGFDEKYVEKIFQPFQRLHGNSAYSGTGMGLAICKKIVDCHNGSITAKSSQGIGSTFTINLPEKQPNINLTK